MGPSTPCGGVRDSALLSVTHHAFVALHALGVGVVRESTFLYFFFLLFLFFFLKEKLGSEGEKKPRRRLGLGEDFGRTQ